jgi:hypothetical protein
MFYQLSWTGLKLIFQMMRIDRSRDWLIIYIAFRPVENFSLLLGRHHCRW